MFLFRKSLLIVLILIDFVNSKPAGQQPDPIEAIQRGYKWQPYEEELKIEAQQVNQVEHQSEVTVNPQFVAEQEALSAEYDEYYQLQNKIDFNQEEPLEDRTDSRSFGDALNIAGSYLLEVFPLWFIIIAVILCCYICCHRCLIECTECCCECVFLPCFGVINRLWCFRKFCSKFSDVTDAFAARQQLAEEYLNYEKLGSLFIEDEEGRLVEHKYTPEPEEQELIQKCEDVVRDIGIGLF